MSQATLAGRPGRFTSWLPRAGFSCPARFILPLRMASGLKFECVNLADFTPQRIDDPEIVRLMKHIRINTGPEKSGFLLTIQGRSFCHA